MSCGEPGNSCRGRVLVIDDEIMVRAVVSAVLRGQGYQVMTTGDGESALRALAAEPYDLVISDLRLPGMPGDALCIEAKRIRPGIPTVLMTGMDVGDDDGRPPGVDFVLGKPFGGDALAAALRQFLDDPANRP